MKLFAKSYLWGAFAAAALIAGSSLSSASQTWTTPNFTDVMAKAEELGRAYGNRNVLIGLDVDNTLLVNNQELGSEQWFDWQAGLLKEKNSPYAVAANFNDLLAIQVRLLDFSTMSLSEPDLPGIIGRLQSEGFNVIVVTARGPEDHDHTLREFRRNGLNFEPGALAPSAGFPSAYEPYAAAGNASQCGISGREALDFKLGPPREVMYSQGIIFTAGQHKGAMIRCLLAKTGIHVKAVVFVDNQQIQVDHVYQAMAPVVADVESIRYSREDDAIARFRAEDKTSVAEAFEKFAAIARLFPGSVPSSGGDPFAGGVESVSPRQ